MQKFWIVVAGPTGVGKTEYADQLAQAIDGEIVNGDLGQMYEPLTIGTAKPNWQAAAVAYHMFDVLKTPTFISVMAFRTQVQTICADIWRRNKIPIVVGGSSYYVTALFFPPAAHTVPITKGVYDKERNVWQELHAIDPQRAAAIDPHDRYRIERALDVWYSTGIKPSAYVPHYDPIAPDYLFIWLERDRQDLYDRIDVRVQQMLNQGWIAEVQALMGTPWESFLLQKKIIGYSDIIAYIKDKLSKPALVAIIQKKTRNYAKRQITFWRMLRTKLQKSQADKQSERDRIVELNLTHAPIDRYIKQLILRIAKSRKIIDT